jgi:hypothetical protein
MNKRKFKNKFFDNMENKYFLKDKTRKTLLDSGIDIEKIKLIKPRYYQEYIKCQKFLISLFE